MNACLGSGLDLTPSPAVDRTEAAIAEAQRNGQEEIRFIVGKGNHSQDHKAKIKPAIEELMRK